MQPFVTIEGSGPAPVGTIYGIGRNYAEHAKELGNAVPTAEPVVFLKASSSIRGGARPADRTNCSTRHQECGMGLH